MFPVCFFYGNLFVLLYYTLNYFPICCSIDIEKFSNESRSNIIKFAFYNLITVQGNSTLAATSTLNLLCACSVVFSMNKTEMLNANFRSFDALISVLFLIILKRCYCREILVDCTDVLKLPCRTSRSTLW